MNISIRLSQHIGLAASREHYGIMRMERDATLLETLFVGAGRPLLMTYIRL